MHVPVLRRTVAGGSGALDRIALGRVAESEKIAAMTVFAASSLASYLTGVVIAMDGASSPIVV